MVCRFLRSPSLLLALALGCAASSANATFFSFASDVNSNSFTFAGSAGVGGSFTMREFSRPNTYSLRIDDNNGPLATLTVPVELHANLLASMGLSTQIAPSLFQHSYRVSGTFGFYDSMGNALLTAEITPANAALLTVPGTQSTWSTTGAVLGADSFANITYTATSALVAALGGTATAASYGISVGSSIGPDDFAFDLSMLNAGSVGSAVAIDATTKAPLTTWRSESSFSGSTFIPAPGTSFLALGGGLMFMRRRRA